MLMPGRFWMGRKLFRMQEGVSFSAENAPITCHHYWMKGPRHRPPKAPAVPGNHLEIVRNDQMPSPMTNKKRQNHHLQGRFLRIATSPAIVPWKLPNKNPCNFRWSKPEKSRPRKSQPRKQPSERKVHLH